MSPDVWNLILLMPIKTRSANHSWEHFLWNSVLPPCYPSLVHQLNSFSGVWAPTLLCLRDCRRPFFLLRGQCLPLSGHVRGQGPVSTLLNTTVPVWAKYLNCITLVSQTWYGNTPLCSDGWGSSRGSKACFFLFEFVPEFYPVPILSKIHTLVQVGAAVCCTGADFNRGLLVSQQY